MIKQKNALQNAERFSVLFQIKCNTRLPCQAETAQIRLISADIQADTSVGRHAPSVGKHGTHPISLGFENNRSALPRIKLCGTYSAKLEVRRSRSAVGESGIELCLFDASAPSRIRYLYRNSHTLVVVSDYFGIAVYEMRIRKPISERIKRLFPHVSVCSAVHRIIGEIGQLRFAAIYCDRQSARGICSAGKHACDGKPAERAPGYHA